MVSFEQTVLTDTIGKLVEEEITPADANLLVSVLAALRSAPGSAAPMERTVMRLSRRPSRTTRCPADFGPPVLL